MILHVSNHFRTCHKKLQRKLNDNHLNLLKSQNAPQPRHNKQLLHTSDVFILTLITHQIVISSYCTSRLFSIARVHISIQKLGEGSVKEAETFFFPTNKSFCSCRFGRLGLPTQRHYNGGHKAATIPLRASTRDIISLIHKPSPLAAESQTCQALLGVSTNRMNLVGMGHKRSSITFSFTHASSYIR